MNLYTFERLRVWQLSKKLVVLVYHITEEFQTHEKFGLVSQLRRASVSVCSNISEGSTRWGARDKARFYEIAFGSLMETLNQLIIAFDLQLLNQSQLE